MAICSNINPEIKNKDFTYFDLLEGKFTNTYKLNTISGEKITQFKKLLGINFDVIEQVNFSGTNRQDVLSILIKYFEFHIEGFKKPKSLNVLKSVFS